MFIDCVLTQEIFSLEISLHMLLLCSHSRIVIYLFHILLVIYFDKEKL